MLKKYLFVLGLGVSILTSTANVSFAGNVDAKAVVTTYANIALAGYEDSLTTAKALKKAVNALISSPTDANLKAARTAWIAARAPYQQTEAFRFGNAAVDDWEGKVNAWPLDEGLIDYVSKDYGTMSEENGYYSANVIANANLKVNGSMIDVSNITPKLLSDTLHEAGEVEANVATGYHAIEFLLWGQDLNGTGPGAGNRPASDYDLKNCTGGNCERRIAYLTAATNLLISDLEDMIAKWGTKGSARAAVLSDGGTAGITAMLTGMGSLSYGELAGERMKLGLILHDPEEEHDCFSDNTHNSHYNDILGIQNVYLGTYKRIDGTVIKGASLSDLVKSSNGDVDKELRAKLNATVASAVVMKKRAEGGEAYDQMIGEGNAEGNQVVQNVIDALVNQTKSMERVTAALKLKPISFEGSDSLDDPSKVE